MAWGDSWSQSRQHDTWGGGWHSKGRGKGKDGKGWREEPYAMQGQRQRGLAGALQQVRDAVAEQHQLQAVARLLGPALEPQAPAHIGLLGIQGPHVTASPLHPPPTVAPEVAPWQAAPVQHPPVPQHDAGGQRDAGAADGILTKIRTLLVGSPARAEAHSRQALAQAEPHSTHVQDGMEEMFDLVRTLTMEVAELRRENQKLRAGRPHAEERGRRAEAPRSRRAAGAREAARGRARTEGPRDRVKEALAAAIAEDGCRTGAGPPDAEIDFELDDAEADFVEPEEHAQFFLAMGAKSSLKQPTPMNKWAGVAARKWSLDEWKAKALKVGYEGDWNHKIESITETFRRWRRLEGARTPGGTPNSAEATH